MRSRGTGHIVTIGSVADRHVFPSNAVYAATKHAVRAVHETLRAETRGSGVRATLISPAATDTPIWDPYDPDASAVLPSRAEMLRAEDVADAVLWAVTRPPHVDIEELRLARS
jgi:NADP-dependent 3-hydroxy acid dehydrogenase YdfG